MNEQKDAVVAEIAAVIGLAQGGHATAARERFTEMWDRIGASGDHLHRCALAHYAADVQTDLNEELLWDLRARRRAGDRLRSPGWRARATSANPVRCQPTSQTAHARRRVHRPCEATADSAKTLRER